MKDNEFKNKKLSNNGSVVVNRNQPRNKEVTSGKYVDDIIGNGTAVRLNKTIGKYLKVTAENYVYIFKKIQQKTNYRYNIDYIPKFGRMFFSKKGRKNVMTQL